MSSTTPSQPTTATSTHVVLALNASDHSRYAFNWSIKNLLNPSTHRVTILTVVEPPVQAGYYYAASAGTIFIKIEKHDYLLNF